MNPAAPASSYRPDIDGLRGVAVLMVVLFHAGLGFKGGYVGVDVFFVISGYLITGLLFKELDRGGIDLAGFWERRLRRIAPALTVVLLFTLAAGALLLFPADFSSLAGSMVAQALLVANVYFWKDSGYFAGASEEKPLLHLWSLAVEEQFYVLLPPLLLLAHRWLARGGRDALTVRKRLVQGLAAVLVASLAASCLWVVRDANSAFYWLPFRAWELLLGSVLAGLPAGWRLRHPRHQEVTAAASLGMILVAALAYRSDTLFPGAAALLPCLGAAGLIWAHNGVSAGTGEVRPRTWGLMTWRPLVAVGLVSYSLYLWHWPLLAFAQYLNVTGEDRVPLPWRLGLVALACLFAWLSWRWVETPFRQKRWLGSRSRVFAAGAAVTAFSLAAGLTIGRQEGWPWRLPEAALKYAAGSQDKLAGELRTEPEEAARGNFPAFGTAGEAPSVLLWGDSHARSLLPLLDSLARDHGQGGIAALYSATSPTLGFYRRSRHGLKEKAEVMAQAVVRQVREKEIRHVILAAYWKECPGDREAAFADALVHTVRALQEAGSQPWVVLDVPDHAFEVPKALALGHLPGGWFPQAADRTPSVQEHRQKNAVMQNLLPRLEAAGANILDPLPLLSGPGQQTLIESEGRSLYSDSHHLSITGAMRLRPLFEPLFGRAAPSGS